MASPRRGGRRHGLAAADRCIARPRSWSQQPCHVGRQGVEATSRIGVDRLEWRGLSELLPCVTVSVKCNEFATSAQTQISDHSVRPRDLGPLHVLGRR